MAPRHSKATIISMAVIASAIGTLLHEGIGHGVTAWLRGDVVTELTSNHLSLLRPDRWVDAGGTLANLIVGSGSLLASRKLEDRANLRYFFWILAAFNLLSGAGYFMFSGIFGFGDWYEVIQGLPHQFAVRAGMTVLGAGLYALVVRLLAVSVHPFVPDRPTYNVVGRLPYYAAGIFSCLAGMLDPLGLKLLLVSTIPAAFGGSSGLIWANELMPRRAPDQSLVVHRAPAWWIAAVVVGICYIVLLGRGVQFAHQNRSANSNCPGGQVAGTCSSETLAINKYVKRMASARSQPRPTYPLIRLTVSNYISHA
jgi:hypothetical protein